MSTQKYDIVEFIRSRLNYNVEELKRERLNYRDLNSLHAQIVNTLLKARINKWSDDKIKLNLTPQVHDTFTAAKQRASELDSFQVETYLRRWTHDEEDLKGTNLKNLTHGRRKIKSSLKVEGLEEESEVLKTIGELAESSDSFHRVSHLSESTASALNTSGVIGGVIANSLGLFINLFRCIKEKRMPNNFEKAKITYSAVILICGAFVLSGLGGALGISIFAASATILAVTRSMFELARDGFRHRSARQKLAHCELVRHFILEQLTQLITQCDTQKRNLLKHPPVGDFESFKNTLDQIEDKYEKLKTLNKNLKFHKLKCQLFAKKQQSRLENLRKNGIRFGGSLSVIGVILSFTPIAPIGLALIGIGALITLVSDFGARFGKFLQRRRDQRTQANHPNEANYAISIDSLATLNTKNDLDSALPSDPSQVDTPPLAPRPAMESQTISPDPSRAPDDNDLHPRL